MFRIQAARLALLVTLGTALATGGCSRKHSEPVDATLNPADVPPVPTGVTLSLATGQITLSWSVANADTAGLAFNVYKAAGPEASAWLATTPEYTFTDDAVINGTSYTYRIAATKNALEGRKSLAVSGTPAAFAIVLEGGAAATSASVNGAGTRTIRVDLVAPASTETFRLSENPGLAGATIRTYAAGSPVTTFVLSANDGPKTVYCAFDLVGGSISQIVSSGIVVDTRAIIMQVTEDSGGTPLAVNDVLHLTVTADATGGSATVDIGEAHRDVELFDDGTNGDSAAFDAVYERDYVITAGGEVVQEPVVGRFTDEVGNVANPVNSATMVTVSDPPPPVAFNEPGFTVVGTSVTLKWSESTAPDFAEYRIYRSPPNQSASVDENDTFVVAIQGRSTRAYTDSGLQAGAEYRWGIEVHDENGFRSPFGTAVRSVQYDPVINGTTLTPVGGTQATVFTYGCTYSHPQSLPPSAVSLVVDDLVMYPMTQVGAGTDWLNGEPFTVDLTLGPGAHSFHFEATASDGSEGLAPSAGAFGGPVVTP